MSPPSPESPANTTTQNGRDRRRRKRLEHELEVMVTAGPRFEAARTRDLSAGGMYILARSTFTGGDRVSLRFTLEERSFRLEAEVAHQRAKIGFGVRFLNATEDERLFILRFVHTERAERTADLTLIDLIPV
jgi:hypothetical protein